MANAAEYKEVFNTRYTNDGGTSIWNDTGATTNPGGTDWWDEVINKTALVQNYSLNISGGSDKLVYNLSMGYYRNNSQYDYGYWDKINARLNTEYTFNKYVKMGFDIAPRVESWDDTPDLFQLPCLWTPQLLYSSRKINGWITNSITISVLTTTRSGTLPVHWPAKIPTPVKWVQL